MAVVDTFHRPLRDLRVSVTDRCNFRCPYCMPKEIYGRKWAFLPRNELLTFEEISRLVRIFASLGVEKVRLTGGEPLLRQELEQLIRMLASIEELQDLTLTTNGSLLASRAERLKEAGLKRVTISLDSLDETTFMAMNDVKFPLAQVLEGIEAATKAGLMPIKVNMVVKRGVNDQDIVPMARYFRHSGHTVRFIEYMDVGHTNDWRWEEVVSAQEIIDQIGAHWPLERIASPYPEEVATRYRYGDGGGEIGIIASVTQPFCRDCTRARLAADGQLYTCLFGSRSYDLRRRLRNGCSDADLAAFLKLIWWRRNDRYSELRSAATVSFDKVEMSRIGG
ncbi:GTP 3',8-cyclase MoaA [Nitrosococcus wardiae]|uniref:GTP 3',8-cyclase n=1 Tax=Nitrosococcus wardiae TaxID=1814290 RepID=A0A4P7C4W8_9GAMM|nr:GTP 3',8-cyclase MoaA [Nitrosococcus wardiae]QBQ55862.1 GTP 3',8-cyclase MoaA [Nitrosococcus wardiae]